MGLTLFGSLHLAYGKRTTPPRLSGLTSRAAMIGEGRTAGFRGIRYQTQKIAPAVLPRQSPYSRHEQRTDCSRGTQKALPHVVTALVAKRAEIAGQIENLQVQVRRLTVDLDHVEETLRLFAPDIDMEAISPRRVPLQHHAFRGETSRIVLESLHKSVWPLSTTQITERVMRERNLDTSDANCAAMSQRVRACLNHRKRERGIIRSMPGPGKVLLWEL